ncbi:putative autotransporter adhesin-like protein [Flavobacterium tiangeerense]|uniref:Autotransporter adhesin-like protein n=1 Tax=Flavobacterium tiangeerense TaxID=459471 RepID=A0ABY3FLN6_9FLAO|nr:head GIN domain-containing protein [Flavobacterium tiangeerense]TWI01176.1 putative autotransporter adhesin-like protein [Flavobacterium tiangeerense]
MKSKIQEYQKSNFRNWSKKIVLLAFVILSQITNAQVSRNLGDFDEVKVFDNIKVLLIPASENKIVITGDRSEELETVNKNGILKIRMPFPKLLSGNDITVKLYYNKIEEISVSEGAYVSSEYDFKQTSLAVNATSGGEVILDLNVEKVNVKVNAGGIVTLTGKATNQDVVITSGGILSSKDLITTQTAISVSAGGEADVYATTLVDAKVRAGGSIFIYGKPKQINKEVFIGGKIQEK